MTILPQYTHIINPKLKHIYLSFSDEGELIIKSPKVSLRKIEQLILNKANWIEKSREKVALKKGKTLDFSKELSLYFMGETYPLTLFKQEKKRTKLLFDGNVFSLYYYDYDEKHFQKYIDRFYKEASQEQIPPIVRAWAREMGLSPAEIRFRKTKRQWGSCSSKNVLSFNTMMMKLPLDVIQYIIVHELAHIKYKHHQKVFWEEVEKYLPHYKSQVQELKNYTT